MKQLKYSRKIPSTSLYDGEITPKDLYARRLPVGLRQLDVNKALDLTLFRSANVVLNTEIAPYLDREQLWMLSENALLSLVSFSSPWQKVTSIRNNLAENGRVLELFKDWLKVGPFIYEGLDIKGGFLGGINYHADRLKLKNNIGITPLGFIDTYHAYKHITISNMLLARNIRAAVSPGYIVLPKDILRIWLLNEWASDKLMQEIIERSFCNVLEDEVALLFRLRMTGERINNAIAHTYYAGLENRFVSINNKSFVTAAIHFLREISIPGTLMVSYLDYTELSKEQLIAGLNEIVATKGLTDLTVLKQLLRGIYYYQAEIKRWEAPVSDCFNFIELTKNFADAKDCDSVLCLYDFEDSIYKRNAPTAAELNFLKANFEILIKLLFNEATEF